MIPSASLHGLPALALADGATTPDPGEAGPWAWSTTLGCPMFWEGSRWRAVVAISVGTTAPASPQVGDLWIDTN